MNKKVIFSLVLVITLFLVSFVLSFFQNTSLNKEQLTVQFQKNFIQKEIETQSLLDKITQNFEINQLQILENKDWIDYTNELYRKNGLIVFIESNDSIHYLSHNILPVTHYDLPEYNFGVEFIKNGWYLTKNTRVGDYTLWSAFLIKEKYNYNNRFLNNEFHPDFKIHDKVQVSLNAAVGEMIYFENGDYALSLLFPDEENLLIKNTFIHWIRIIINIILIFSILLFGIEFIQFLTRNQSFLLRFSFIFTFLIFLRWVIFYFKIPYVLHQSELFSAQYYALNYYFPSLGDLLLHVIFFNVLLFYLFLHIPKVIPASNVINRFKSILFVSCSYLIIAFYSFLLVIFIHGLVLNSHLLLNVYFIFDVNIYNILGFVILGLFFLSFYFLKNIILYFLQSFVFTKSNLPLFWYSYAVAIIFFFIFFDQYFLLWIFLFSTAHFYFLVVFKRSGERSFSGYLILFFLYALISTYALHIFNNEKEYSQRQNLALKISSEQDPVAEFLFYEIESDLMTDGFLESLVINDPYNEEEILNYLKNNYFGEISLKYDMQVTTCTEKEKLIIKPFNEEVMCYDYFNFFIEKYGKTTMSEHFIYLDNNTGRNSYITPIFFQDPGNPEIKYTVFLEFESKFIPHELGFPELLIDEQIDISRNPGEYSYAIYKNDVMTHKFGSHLFNLNAQSYDYDENETFNLIHKDKYSHLLYQRDAETLIIVSKPKDSFLEKIAPFSYLFIVFILLSIAVYLPGIKHSFVNVFHFNFKKRLQSFMIGIVLISVLSIGGVSAGFIYNIYNDKNISFINEKAHSILIEMENLLSSEPYLNTDYQEYLNGILLRLSNVFFTDINLFDPSGYLIASSRMRVFNEGLVASHMHPVAFYELNHNKKSLFIHNEKIGELNYLSTYVPLMNMNNELIAYINLPYFAKQSELRNEISYFLVAFVNIYLILLLVTLIIAYFISDYVTRPLQIIRNNLSMIRFGKTNQKIEWTRKDEIGQLIGEYNRMIDELEASAELLARSERESAWREMAKQVAHEIKNPLTPMRLNVQYLERAWKSKEENWDERLEKFTKSMVEQIDTLAVIASEFSDFAKMPVSTKFEKIDLRELIVQLPDLYQGYDNLTLEYSLPDNHQPMMILADRKQLLRVFNNLIKNGIQAYDRNQEAMISIQCQMEDNFIRVEIIDFGRGIPEDQKENIFQPYFTTKSSGTGLGLAMVKSILSGFNANITFRSDVRKGTTFIIRFPR